MREMLSRLRAALTPQALLFLSALLLLAGGMMNRNADTAASLERRIERTLSQVEGAGRVHVVIQSETVKSGGAMSAQQNQTYISGAVAVSPGADDPMVRLALEEALCALLGLPPSAVNVMPGGK